MARKKRTPEIRIQFGLAVKQRREELGLTQETLAAKAGLHRSYIGDIERGKRNIAIDNLSKLVEAMGLSVPAFFSKYHVGDGGPDA